MTDAPTAADLRRFLRNHYPGYYREVIALFDQLEAGWLARIAELEEIRRNQRAAIASYAERIAAMAKEKPPSADGALLRELRAWVELEMRNESWWRPCITAQIDDLLARAAPPEASDREQQADAVAVRATLRAERAEAEAQRLRAEMDARVPRRVRSVYLDGKHIREHGRVVTVMQSECGEFLDVFVDRGESAAPPAAAEPDTDTIERLAELEHEQWIAWASTLIEKEVLSESRVNRWNKLMVPYSELTEEMKEHDRVWARKVLAALEGRQP